MQDASESSSLLPPGYADEQADSHSAVVHCLAHSRYFRHAASRAQTLSTSQHDPCMHESQEAVEYASSVEHAGGGAGDGDACEERPSEAATQSSTSLQFFEKQRAAPLSASSE